MQRVIHKRRVGRLFARAVFSPAAVWDLAVSELDSVVGEPDGDQDERNPDESVRNAGKNIHADNIAIELKLDRLTYVAMRPAAI